MSQQHILITGGAGFIGSHLADELRQSGHNGRALDSLASQGSGAPDYLDPDVELIHGDVRDPIVVRRALQGIDAVYHFAAAVGVGQSMYEIERYTDINSAGTAVLLDALVRRPVQRLVVASSMSIYGEGLYRGRDGAERPVGERSIEQLKQSQWEFLDEDGTALTPIPTPERKTPSLSSIYALTKYSQERMCLMIGGAYQPLDPLLRASGINESRPLDLHSPYGCSKGAADEYIIDYARTFGIPALVFRMSCIYGPPQFGNEDQGWIAHFLICALDGRPITLYGDGRQVRDILYVDDLIEAFLLARSHSRALSGQAFNIGGGPGHMLSLLELLGMIHGFAGAPPHVESGDWRFGEPNFLYTHNFTLDQLPDALGALAERPEGFLKGWITF